MFVSSKVQKSPPPALFHIFHSVQIFSFPRIFSPNATEQD
jgi:hypothetical protein